jgi:phage terminase large subunit
LTIYEVQHQDAQAVKLYGGARQLWLSKSPHIIISGPFETGKTFGALHKLDALLWKYPNARALMVRQTYKSTLSSVRVTYEDKILPEETPIKPYGGERPEFYIYPNDSMLYLGGLDNPDKFLSSEWDFIYINQTEEITKDAYEKLCARATGRAGNTPYTQVIGDCNPSYPGHWILQKKSAGELVFLEQFHRDNPMLYNQETGEITEQGKRTMEVLHKLTGVRRERGLLNRWVAAEGIIFDNFSHTGNVTESAEYNPELETYWGIDDGYAEGSGIGTISHHPRVILLAQQTAIGGINVFEEYYQTQTMPEASLDEVMSWPYNLPRMALVDSSAAELRRRLSDKQIFNGAATHRVSDGIKIARRFICDGNGVRLLKIHPRCENLIRELQSYRYDDKARTAEAGEPRPMKLDDHCPDALRYLLWNFK